MAHTFVQDVLIDDLRKLNITTISGTQITKIQNFHKFHVRKYNQIIRIVTTNDLVKIYSVSYNSKIRRICDEILTRMEKK